ncbi:MAG: hypothetical protein MI919_18540, partial [Holophagales bacterium]|nr:hypothetical protein [Holophagales bacterium]
MKLPNEKILRRLGEHRHRIRLPFPRPQYEASFLGRAWDRFHLWATSKSLTLALAIFASLLSRLRMSHNNGVVAAGKLRIVDDPQFPLHPFFVPGKVFDCRIRHAAASFMDDAMRCVRSGSLKFADTEFASPFDLELNTGKVALFWSAASFYRFAFEKKERYGIQYTEYYRHLPEGARGAYEGLRRNPESYADQHYYNQTPLYYVTPDGTIR